MKSRIFTGLAVLCLFTLAAPASQADYTVYYSPLNWSTRDASLEVRPAAQDAAIRVTANSQGDFKWLQFGLSVASTDPIEAVTVCYQRSTNSESFISQVRLNMMTIPPSALVIYDDQTALMDPGPTCYHGELQPEWLPEGTITLKVAMDFWNLNDWIEIGMIALHFREPLNGLNDDQPTLEGNLLQLRQNSPNPFNPSTMIAYLLDQEGPVEVQIHDVSGRQVRELVREEQQAGEHHIPWDGRDDHGNDLPAGKYFFSVRLGDATDARGMILLR